MVATCWLVIPALPSVTTVSSTGSIVSKMPTFAYDPSHTNYFGGTSIKLLSLGQPTPYTGQAYSTVKCTVPASIAGKAYAVTPIIYVPRSVSSKFVSRDQYTCDPIPAASINAGNIKFGCTGLPGKSMGNGAHTIGWITPSGAVPLRTSSFFVTTPMFSTTIKVNPASAKTNLIPTTVAHETVLASKTVTLPTSTQIIRVTTATVTSICTVTVFTSATLSPSTEGANGTPRVKAINNPGATITKSIIKMRDESDYSVVPDDYDTGLSGLDTEHLDHEQPDEPRGLRFKRAPTIGKPDYTYGPTGTTTIWVSSYYTSTCTNTRYSIFTVTPAVVTVTTSVQAYSQVYSTVTVTKGPSSTTTNTILPTAV